MYSRYFTFKTTAANRKSIEKMADGIYNYSKSLKGFISATYTISEDETEYGSFTIWQSKEDADNAGVAIRNKVMPELEGILTAPPEISVMEVYEPKS